MKPRFWLLLLVTVFVLFLIFWPRPNQPVRVVEQRSEVPPSVNPAAVAEVSQSVPSTNPNHGEILKRRNPEKVKQENEAFDKRMAARNLPIDFYGQTVDQDGNSLPGVHIKMMVAHYLPGMEGMSIPVNRTSDANGLFDVHDANVTGDGIDIEYMSKEGYALEPMTRSFGPVGGAPGNPVIFRLWRNDIKEPLITGQKSFSIEPNGTSYIVDLTKGTISQSDGEDGDLKLRINMPPPVGGKYPDWWCEFRTVNGGLAEETDSSSPMFLAPTAGYTNLFSFSESATNPWNRQSGNLRFFLRLKNGNEYGRISIDMAACARNPNRLRIEYAINPTGSLILR